MRKPRISRKGFWDRRIFCKTLWYYWQFRNLVMLLSENPRLREKNHEGVTRSPSIQQSLVLSKEPLKDSWIPLTTYRTIFIYLGSVFILLIRKNLHSLPFPCQMFHEHLKIKLIYIFCQNMRSHLEINTFRYWDFFLWTRDVGKAHATMKMT